MTDMDRRYFVKGAAALLLGGCAGLSMRPKEPFLLASYLMHIRNQREPYGADTSFYYGAAVNSLGIGTAWVTSERRGATGLITETEMGHLLDQSGVDRLDVLPGDELDYETCIGTEGYETPHATTNHTHNGVRVQPYAKEFKQPHERVTYRAPSGIEYDMEDPQSHALNGRDILTSFPEGGEPKILREKREGEERLNSIGEKYADTAAGFFIRNSKKNRFFPRTVVPYLMYTNGLIGYEALKKDLFDYWRWHSHVKAGIISPYYVAHVLKGECKRPKNYDPNRKEKMRVAWADAAKKFNAGKWQDALTSFEEFKQITPIGGIPGIGGDETWLARNIGIAYAKLGEYEKAVIGLLTAEAVNTYKDVSAKEKQLFDRGVYGNFVRAYSSPEMGKVIGIAEQSKMLKYYSQKFMAVK